MKRSRARALAAVLVLAAGGVAELHAKDRSTLAAAAECRAGEVGVVIPAFSAGRLGEDSPPGATGRLRGSPLGQQVATVLNLQIWQSLRRSDGRGGSFGHGVVVWDPLPLAEPAFAAAEAKAEALNCQFAFWGRAWTYGEDIVAQTYLSILGQPVLWRSQSLELGFPRRRYEFAPIVLKPEVVERFSRPSALVLTGSPEGGTQQGTLGLEFVAIEQHEGIDAARVQSGGNQGWVQLPQLGRNRSEVVDFIGGVIRMLRRDWQGAHEYLQRVIDDAAAPASLFIDSLLLQAVASENQGSNGWPMIERAFERNPHSRITARYALMQRLSALARARSAGQPTERERESLAQTLADTRHLFADDDSWVVEAQLLLAPR